MMEKTPSQEELTLQVKLLRTSVDTLLTSNEVARKEIDPIDKKLQQIENILNIPGGVEISALKKLISELQPFTSALERLPVIDRLSLAQDRLILLQASWNNTTSFAKELTQEQLQEQVRTYKGEIQEIRNQYTSCLLDLGSQGKPLQQIQAKLDQLVIACTNLLEGGVINLQKVGKQLNGIVTASQEITQNSISNYKREVTQLLRQEQKTFAKTRNREDCIKRLQEGVSRISKSLLGKDHAIEIFQKGLANMKHTITKAGVMAEQKGQDGELAMDNKLRELLNTLLSSLTIKEKSVPKLNIQEIQGVSPPPAAVSDEITNLQEALEYACPLQDVENKGKQAIELLFDDVFELVEQRLSNDEIKKRLQDSVHQPPIPEEISWEEFHNTPDHLRGGAFGKNKEFQTHLQDYVQKIWKPGEKRAFTPLVDERILGLQDQAIEQMFASQKVLDAIEAYRETLTP
ncbi:MAG: hypothetical protein FJZ58_00820 [Chlamydiae bacterium]|nr:hypothetical protein [Chlamydiota bacterium]